jgi:hypothetical protein
MKAGRVVGYPSINGIVQELPVMRPESGPELVAEVVCEIACFRRGAKYFSRLRRIVRWTSH